MQYFVMLENTEDIYFYDSLLAPNSEFDGLHHDLCEKTGLCEKCNETCDMNTKCHVMRKIAPNTWDKLCPVLFHDAVKPKWKLKDLI